MVFFLLAVIFYFLFSAAEPYNADNNAVTLYFADNLSASHQATIERFNEKYKGRIKVEGISLPFHKFSTNERKELLARSLRSKADKLDIFSVDQIWVSRFSRWSIKLDEYVSASMLEDLVPGAVNSCYFDSSLYALPLYMDIGLMYGNSRELKKLNPDEEFLKNLEYSITWEELTELSKKSNENFYIFPADNYEGLICSYIEMILNLNRNFFDNNFRDEKSYKIDLTRPEAVKALRTLVDAVNKYNMSPKEVPIFKEDEVFKRFVHEDGVFMRGWPAYTLSFADFYKERGLPNPVKKYPLPHYEGTTPAFIFGGWNLMISKYSKNKKEATIFLKYLISEESQKMMYEVGNYLPVLKKSYTSDAWLTKFGDLGYFYGLFEYGVNRPIVLDYTRISDIISYYVNKAIKKELSVDKALRDATKMINDGRVLIK